MQERGLVFSAWTVSSTQPGRGLQGVLRELSERCPAKPQMTAQTIHAARPSSPRS